MGKIHIIADSTCDLSPELAQKYGVTILPLYIQRGEESLKDGLEIVPEQIFEYFEQTGKLCKTAAVSVGDYLEKFEPIVKSGDAIVHFTISSEMSSCYQNACIAAQELGGEIHVVDSRNLSTGIGLLVIKACKLRDEGSSAQEIFDAVTALIPQVRTTFVIDSLEYLAKGGRCSAIAALGANMLKLKPCIIVSDGQMSVGKKYRGNMTKMLPQYVADQLGTGESVDPDCIFVEHTGAAPEIVQKVCDQVRALVSPSDLYIVVAGSTISSHCGRNVLGVIYFEKN